MSDWVTFAFVMVLLFGSPRVRAKRSDAAAVAMWAIYAVVLLSMLGALLVDAKGWP